MKQLDQKELDTKVKSMYKAVAENPEDEFHFEMGRSVAERLGYPSEVLDKVPKEAVDSFAGVGHPFEVADIQPGDSVLDLGSGSGMDLFIAALKTGEEGSVTGVDITKEQISKARTLAKNNGFENVKLQETYIEELPIDDDSFDVIISNGVVNLSSRKDEVFKQAARVLKPGGQMAISDIVSNEPLTEAIKCDASLWASCIGGAMQVDAYKALISAAGLEVLEVKDNPQYQFISDSAKSATEEFGVKSITLLARKTAN